MRKNLFNQGLAVVIFAILASGLGSGQQAWQKIAPVGESFSVLMPDKAKEATRLVPVSENDPRIPERVYYSIAGDKRFMIMSFLKTSPDRLLALSSLENFLGSMEHAFKMDQKELSKSLTFDREVSMANYTARQYHIKVGDYPGVARFLGTEKACYALMAIGAEESDAEVLRFLSSFQLGEPNTSSESSGVTLAIPIDFGDASASSINGSPATLPPEPWPNTLRSINGGVLNGKAISLPRPKYPKEARDAHDSGIVEVNIVIDEQGNVIKAQANSGPMSLRDASVAAALQARFTPTRLMGQPVKVSGRIVYNFVAY